MVDLVDLGFGLVLGLVNFDFVVNLTALGLGSNPGLGLNFKIFQNFLANQLWFDRKYFLKKYFSFLFQKYLLKVLKSNLLANHPALICDHY